MNTNKYNDPPEKLKFGSFEHLEWGQVALFKQTQLLEKVKNKFQDAEDHRGMSISFTLNSIIETTRTILLISKRNVRDSYALSRILFDATLNIGYYSINDELVRKAINHASQKSFRDLFRDINLEDGTVINSFNGINDFTIPKKLKEALYEFTNSKNKEIREWSPESKMNVFKKIELISSEIDEDIGSVLNFCLFSIYRHSSEVIHGTLFGSFFGLGFNLIDKANIVKNTEEHQNYIYSMNSYLMHVLNLLLESSLKMINLNYPIPKILKSSRGYSNHLSKMTTKS